MIAVADFLVFGRMLSDTPAAGAWTDAMVTDRRYRTGMDQHAALRELKRCSGTKFDPRVLAAFELALAASGQALIFA